MSRLSASRTHTLLWCTPTPFFVGFPNLLLRSPECVFSRTRVGGLSLLVRLGNPPQTGFSPVLVTSGTNGTGWRVSNFILGFPSSTKVHYTDPGSDFKFLQISLFFFLWVSSCSILSVTDRVLFLMVFRFFVCFCFRLFLFSGVYFSFQSVNFTCVLLFLLP